MANKYMKKVSNILSHEGNANQNYTEIHLTLVTMAIIGKVSNRAGCDGAYPGGRGRRSIPLLGM
jgi:hypothetical protein